MIKLDILSDPICPWCYIGKNNLDRVLAKEPINPFTIEWHPFQLNPEMPLAGMNRQDYLEQKFGGKQNAYRVYSRISSTAVKAGLNLELQLIKKTPNTLNAHRLIHWAGIEGLQNSVVSALFESYFVKGEDIGDLSTLVKIGASVGLDKDLISKLLKEDTELIEIKQRDANSRERGVTGVPTFIIANTHVLPGAQTEELWSSILLDIKQLKQDKNAE
ncbi:DsbA family oxidoreductase [Paracoccaceae bacterium]|jgi:predicted DsbA family dithiol-disulfide isomerase|nr:polyketide biosynthesis protein [Paracoccaceae bacterium]MBT4777822.1 DsbA family oxidoreductase [Paracoccaceae bacterium]MBT6270878.1 DsbA family oxidoreductase [Paracoccaceae bacterium]MDC0108301.1 DsbA family oxidoreductase [Paracoccaceae bacterium]MDG1299162.1 DsbA family oxidoreductase [Paracoccaceae bacterium]|tara:strand:+ start:80 stop:730 length:651 start_codon:yes stop_codon:yes gene_type:complete